MSGEAVLVIGQLHQGGAEGQLVGLALGLRGSAYRPVVACLSQVTEPNGSRLAAEGIPVEVFPRRRSGDLARLRALGRFLRGRSPAVVHSWLVGANAYAYGASRWRGAPPFIAASRTTMTIPGAVGRLVHGWVFRHADAVIANSETVRRFTTGYYGVDPERVRVIPNGVDMKRFPGGEEGAARFRREMGAGKEDLLVGTLGRLAPEKGLETIIEAASRTAPGAGIVFAVIGDGPQRSRLEALVRERCPGAAVRFAGARDDVPEVLAALDLFVLASRTEGLSNALMEAMAAGLPVIATRVGSAAEIVEEGRTGWLFEAGDAPALAGHISRLHGSPEERRAVGAAGRERIASAYSVEAMVRRTVEAYDAVRSVR